MRRVRGVRWPWTVVGAGVAVAVASLVDGGGVIAQAQAAAPLVGVLGVAVAAWLGVTRRVAPAVVAAVAAVTLLAPVVALPPAFVPRGERTLSVLSINTFVGEADAESILAEVDRRDVDVLVLPEMSDPLWTRLDRLGLRERLPHVTGRTGGGAGMVVATRRPAECVDLTPGVRCGEVAYTGKRAPGPDAAGHPTLDQMTLRLEDGTLLRGVHLWSPRLAPTSRWREQQAELATWLDAHRGERVVLAGDFNAGPSHPAFRRYARDLDRVPRGDLPWTRTWHVASWLPPFTQIDHVLTRGWRPVESDTVDVPGSDHRGVWALLTR